MYLGKKTKIPLKFRFSKLRLNIFAEILNVAIPNFFKDSIYCLMAVFVNGILLDDMGQIGVLIYSTSIKIEELLIVSVRAYGRGLMSVTGQLFGSKDIEKLKKLYHYVLKVAFATTMVISILFILSRDAIFYSFSITGMEMAVKYIALMGTVILVSDATLLITSKTIDSFGKSHYNLLFTVLLVLFEVGMILVFREIFTNGFSVLLGIATAQAISVAAYYIFLRHLFNKFEKQKEEGILKVV